MKISALFKTLIAVGLAVAVSAPAAYADRQVFSGENGICVEWDSDSDDNTCWVTNPGEIEPIGTWAPYEGKIVIPERVIGRKVIGIKEIAFKGCSNLTEITIPGTVEKISDHAFEGCTSLRNVYFLAGDSILDVGRTHVQQGAFHDCPLDSIFLDRNIKFSYHPFYGTLRAIGLGSNISELPREIFQYCTGIQTLVIPPTMHKIGVNAFQYADIKNLIIESSEEYLDCGGYKDSSMWNPSAKAFTTCRFRSIEIDRPISGLGGQSTVEYLKIGKNFTPGDGLFSNCKRLKTADVSVKIIPKNCFAFCDSLSTLILREGVENIGQSAFNSCNMLTEVTFPESFTNIDEKYGAYGDDQFQRCVSLKKVSNLNCEQIPKSMFYGCVSLNEIMFGPNVKVIKANAFDGCKALKELTIPANVATMCGNACVACDSLEVLMFEDSTEPIDFDNTRSWQNPIKKIYLGREVNYDPDMYRYVYFSPLADERCGEEIEFGPMVTKIPYSFLRHATHLVNVIIGPGVETIEGRAFRECSSLKEIFIPKNVKHICDDAFGYCSSLEKIIFETSDVVTSRSADSEPMILDANAFINSANIREIAITGNTMPSMNPGAFHADVYANAKLIVPEGQKDEYKADAAWGKFNYIEEAPTSGIAAPEVADDEVTAIYTLDGRSISTTATLTPGVYILHHASGKTTKQIVK